MGIVWARVRSLLISVEFGQVSFNALKKKKKLHSWRLLSVFCCTALNLTEWRQISMCDFSMDNRQSYLMFSSVSRRSCAREGENHPHDRWVLHLRNIAFLDQSPQLCDHRASSSCTHIHVQHEWMLMWILTLQLYNLYYVVLDRTRCGLKALSWLMQHM